MIQTIKQNKKAVLAFLLALVMLIGLIQFTATEVQAVTIPVGDITTNNSFGTGAEWQDGDELYFCRVSKDNQWEEYTLTANVEDEVTTWTPSEKLYWDDKGEHKLVVNYPADTGWVWDTWYILEDQSTLEKLKRADHMNAMWKGNPTTDPINLNLKHRLSMVTVTYTFASEFANEPDIAPEVYSNTQYMLFDIHTLERKNVEWQEGQDIWVKAYKHNVVDGEGNITARKFTAIVSPDAYSAGDEFIRITIGDQVLTAKMEEDITFEEGTHYTFDLKVGKDKVEIETVKVNGEFPGGWENEVNLDGTTDTIGIPDVGKTAWEDGDLLAFDFTSNKYGDFLNGVIYQNNAWSSTVYPILTKMTYLENETPTVSAIYSPIYSLSDFGEVQVGGYLDGDDIEEGKYEIIQVGCTLSGTTITADFSNATRNYSRLRIVGPPNQTLTVTTTGFTPAGSNTVVTAPYTLTTDENGNAFLYGVFAEGATVVVKQGEGTLAEYAFTAEKHPGGTKSGKSYVLSTFAASVTVDGVTTNFANIDAAFAEVSGKKASIVIHNDAMLSGMATLGSGTDLLLDLNGKYLSLVEGSNALNAIFMMSTNLTIQDSGIGGTINGGVGASNSTVSLLSGTVDRISASSGGSLTINGGTVTKGIRSNGATVTIEGGTVAASAEGVAASVNLNSGTLIVKGSPILADIVASVSGGTVNLEEYSGCNGKLIYIGAAFDTIYDVISVPDGYGLYLNDTLLDSNAGASISNKLVIKAK